MFRQTYVRIFLYLLGLGFFGLIVSCSAVPDRPERGAPRDGLPMLQPDLNSAAAVPGKDETPTSSGPGALDDRSAPELTEALPEGAVEGGPEPEGFEAPGAFRLAIEGEALASLEAASLEAASLEAASLEAVAPASAPLDEIISPGPNSADSVVTSTTIRRAPPPAGTPEGTIREVGMYLAQDYGRYVGGLGDGRSTVGPGHPDRIVAAARLVAWSFVAESWSPDESLVAHAVNALAEPDVPAELRVLAAAGLERLGRRIEAREVADAVYPESPTAPTPQAGGTAEGSSEFRLASVTFASKIDGPRDFQPRTFTLVPPGHTVLVYGEFQNATHEARTDDASGAFVYRRSFVAYLQLVSPTGEEVERVDFLPRDRGEHATRRLDEPINFWARYLIPSDLPSGTYRLRIHATDVLAERYASAELEIRVGRTGTFHGGDS